MAAPQEVNKRETYVCIKECYTYNKRFRVGDKFPVEWLQNDYYPNHHFMPRADAEHHIATLRKGGDKRVQFAGDDPRSTKDLIETLVKHTNVNPKWTRAEIWAKLNEYETATSKTAPQPERGKK